MAFRVSAALFYGSVRGLPHTELERTTNKRQLLPALRRAGLGVSGASHPRRQPLYLSSRARGRLQDDGYNREQPAEHEFFGYPALISPRNAADYKETLKCPGRGPRAGHWVTKSEAGDLVAYMTGRESA